MRYALTGATGFVGGALALMLRRDGHDVRALVRDPGRAGRLADAGVELVAGDLDDAEALDTLCRDVDGLFHVAGWYKVGSKTPQDGWRVNVEGTRNVLLAAARQQVPRTVYTSTLAVNSDTGGVVVDETYRFTGRHLSVYDETKAAAHDLAVEHASEGLDLVIVMPGVVYGPGDTSQLGGIVDQAAHGRRVLVPADGGKCWAHVDDVARGHVLAMENGDRGAAYMLAGPRATIPEALRLVARLAHAPAPVVLPGGMVRATATLAGALGGVLGRFAPADYSAESLRASMASYLGDPTRAREELGWEARELEAGLRETVAAVRGTG